MTTTIEPSRSEQSAYEALTSLIRSGAFVGGQPLRASQLAELIGVSRTPVREALSKLAAQGIVEIRANRGARLVELGREDIEDLFDLRCVLESHAAGRAAERITAEELASLDTLVDRMDACAEQEGDMLKVAQLNHEFHSAIIAAAGSKLMTKVLADAEREPLISRIGRKARVDMVRQSREHRDIVSALKMGNSPWASAAMLCHIESARSFYL